MISFTIDGTSYQAEQGMTWYEWCQSEYNTGDWMVSGANQVTSPSRNVYISGVNQNDVISANAAYSSIVGGGSGN